MLNVLEQEKNKYQHGSKPWVLGRSISPQNPIKIITNKQPPGL